MRAEIWWGNLVEDREVAGTVALTWIFREICCEDGRLRIMLDGGF
jgi:hypothetical protein